MYRSRKDWIHGSMLLRGRWSTTGTSFVIESDCNRPPRVSFLGLRRERIADTGAGWRVPVRQRREWPSEASTAAGRSRGDRMSRSRESMCTPVNTLAHDLP